MDIRIQVEKCIYAFETCCYPIANLDMALLSSHVATDLKKRRQVEYVNGPVVGAGLKITTAAYGFKTSGSASRSGTGTTA